MKLIPAGIRATALLRQGHSTLDLSYALSNGAGCGLLPFGAGGPDAGQPEKRVVSIQPCTGIIWPSFWAEPGQLVVGSSCGIFA